MTRKLVAEFMGTFWLVLGGCGAAVLAANFAGHGIGLLGVSLAFGLTVITMAYAVGHISGGHFNPAVTLGMLVAGRVDGRTAGAYVVTQVVGACAAATLLAFIAGSVPNFDPGAHGLAANGYGPLSPGGYGLTVAFTTELVMTFFFLVVILGSTSRGARSSFAPLAIGLSLVLIHLVSIPVTNTSVNPARSTGPALLTGGPALDQLWLFWIAPMLGAVLAGAVFRCLEPREKRLTSEVGDATWVA